MTDESSVDKQRVSELRDRTNWAKRKMIAAKIAQDQTEVEVKLQRARARNLERQVMRLEALWTELSDEWRQAARQLEHSSDSERDD